MPRIETNGINTYYEEYGTGPPIVVLHGATADHQVWAEQLQPFTDEYRIILYDLRGHGHTGGSDEQRYTVETYVTDLADFIETLGLDHPVILGHSWGGMIGYRFAAEYPDHLAGLITVGSSTSHLASKREWLFKVAVVRLVTPLMGNERLMKGFQWAQTKVFGEEASGDMDVQERLRQAHDCKDADGEPEIATNERVKIMRAVRDYYSSTYSLDFSTTPVLMLYGEHEPMIDNHADYLEANLANCESIEVPGAGHNAHLDDPEFIRTQIREFLDEALDMGKRDVSPPTEGDE